MYFILHKNNQAKILQKIALHIVNKNLNWKANFFNQLKRIKMLKHTAHEILNALLTSL